MDAHIERELESIRNTFERHESRDDERFREQQNALQEGLDDISTAIQESARVLGEQLAEIHIETKATNGRVTGLEKREAGRDGATGVLKYVTPLLCTLILGCLSWVLYTLYDMNGEVQSLKATVGHSNFTPFYGTDS